MRHPVRDLLPSMAHRDRLPANQHAPLDLLAALLKQHGIVTLYTHDWDFRRFEFLEVRNSFSGSAWCRRVPSRDSAGLDGAGGE